MSTHNEPDRPLQNLDGDLRLGKPLGRGSAGTVVEGFQIGLQREVAVKRLHALGGRVDHRRFATESEVLARVAHPNIVPVLCHGLLDGIPVLVMERVDGCDLAHVIRSMGEAATPGGLDALARALPASDLPWPGGTPWWKVAASIIAQLARALDHAHRCGVIHHDLKPSNILLSREGRALLCDFGVAEEQGPAGESQLSVSSTSGNVAYSAPEELQGKGSTHVSDLYSLGVIARELVSLSSAYGDSTGQAPRISAIDQGLLSPLDRKLPKDLKAVLSHATAMEPGNRYRTSGDFARDLEAVIEGRAISIRPDGWIRVTRRWLRQNTKAAGLVLGFIALLVAVPTAFQYARLNQALHIQEANQLAGQHLSFALRGIESMLVHLGSDGLKGQPRLDLARAELLESGSQLCERLHSTLTSQDSSEFREQISRVQAKAWIGLVAVYSRVGDLERADHFLGRLDAMETSPSANLAARIQYTRMLLAHSQGDFEAIEAMGPNLIAQLAQQADDDAPLALRRSGIWAALMESAIASGDPQLGVERGLEATRALRNWIELAPEPSMAQRELARVLGNHAAALIESGRTDQGEEASLESNAILEKLPSAPLIQILTATNWNNLGSIARNREKFAAAERMERKALELQEQALAHLPSHVHLRFHADRSRYRVALSMRLQNKTGDDAHGLLTDA
ncbi:MAG: serine/threonine-protein kinase, partial [Planctomycetota bacterium]|nr:serine/threonine-protein kinase [Planctomycetota bacterium]